MQLSHFEPVSFEYKHLLKYGVVNVYVAKHSGKFTLTSLGPLLAGGISTMFESKILCLFQAETVQEQTDAVHKVNIERRKLYTASVFPSCSQMSVFQKGSPMAYRSRIQIHTLNKNCCIIHKDSSLNTVGRNYMFLTPKSKIGPSFAFWFDGISGHLFPKVCEIARR